MSKENKTNISEKTVREQTLELLCADCYNFYSNTSSENVEQLLCQNCITKLVAENKKIAEKYIKEGSVGMLIFGFFWGFVKAFFDIFKHMFIYAFNPSESKLYASVFNMFRDIFRFMFFLFIYPFRVSTALKQKKQAEVIVASDSQTQQEMQDYKGEKSAHAEMCKKIYQIFANCEILKSFEKKK